MKITTAEERVFVFKEQLSQEQAEGRAWGRKLDAFGTLSKMTSFLQKPKDEDFEMIYKEHRYQPFWHVVCKAAYDYERTSSFAISVPRSEVKSVTIAGIDQPVSNQKVTISGIEHCHEDLNQQEFVDGISATHSDGLHDYFKYQTLEIAQDQLSGFAPEGVIVVPPTTKASTIVREILSKLIKGISADTIHEESVEIEHIDLYYRPVYAFQYRWKTKAKEAILECDALTGKLQIGESVFQQYAGKVLDPGFLFDVGMDALDLIVPGGGLVAKLAKKGIESSRKK